MRLRGGGGTGRAAHGGLRGSKEFGMERVMRDVWDWGIAGGAIDIQTVNIASAVVAADLINGS